MKCSISIILTILLSISFVGSTALAQLPGDCNGNGELDIDDVTFIISYLVGDGPEPLPEARSNCDCDNNPGISIADAAFALSNIMGGDPPLFPPTGTELTKGSRSIMYTDGRATGVPGMDRIAVHIAVEPTETIDGFLVPFSYASLVGDADISVTSVDFTGSLLEGSISAIIDDPNKVLMLYDDPLTEPSLAGGTIGLLATVYFTQNAPGNAVALLKTSTDRVSPLLFPEDFVSDNGARVLYPGFVERPIGDIDCSYSVDIDDVVRTVNYIFCGGSICYW
jgi:hypothetical protein